MKAEVFLADSLLPLQCLEFSLTNNNFWINELFYQLHRIVEAVEAAPYKEN